MAKAATAQLVAELQQEVPSALQFYYVYLWDKILPYFKSKYSAYQLQELEDCYPSAFLFFIRKLQTPGFQPENLDGYAFRIIYGKFRDRFKRTKRAYATAPDEMPDLMAAPTNHHRHITTAFEERQAPQLIQWFYTLNDREQQLLELFLQGYNLKEIARQLDLAHGSARNQYSRLIKSAKRVLDQQFLMWQ
jgi:RNA polymerase sigma factor (sigma-70 family)